MISKRHFMFNIGIIVIPWLSILFLGKRNFKRFSLAGIFIVIFEIINHKIGQKRKWWAFFNKPKSFLVNELPFSIGPYMPLSMWILRFTYGSFKKFILVNAVADWIFAYFIMPFLKRIRIIRLKRLSPFQFFMYIHYKAYILYGVQYLVDKIKDNRPRLNND